MKDKIKWKKAEARGYVNVDADINIWCPCDEKNETLYMQGDGEFVTCSKCGKVYRTIVYVRVQEMIK